MIFVLGRKESDPRSAQTEKRLQEDTARRWLSTSQGEMPQEKSTPQHLDCDLPASETIGKLLSVV
jgi:hypothetical protein